MCQEIRIQALYSNEIETSGLPLHDAEKAHSEEVRFNVNRQRQPSMSNDWHLYIVFGTVRPKYAR